MRTKVATVGRKIPDAAEVNQEEKLDGNGDKEGTVKDCLLYTSDAADDSGQV